MGQIQLAEIYRGYIDCLNSQAWSQLGKFVGEEVHYNGTLVGLTGYRAMLEGDFRAIPDLVFHVALLVADLTHVASRLHFDCTPTGTLFGLAVNGRRVQFDENVFYEFHAGRISRVWSIIDKAAIAFQIEPAPQ